MVRNEFVWCLYHPIARTVDSFRVIIFDDAIFAMRRVFDGEPISIGIEIGFNKL